MKGYNEGRIFDKEDGEEKGELTEFSLEAVVRSAAQRMIEGALEAEVTEFLGRLPGEKSERGEGFRGYRNGYHKERLVTTAVGGLTVRQPRISVQVMPDGWNRKDGKMFASPFAEVHPSRQCLGIVYSKGEPLGTSKGATGAV